MRRAVVILTGVLLASAALDPYHYYFYWSYDVPQWVWWKPAIAVVDGSLLVAALVLLVRRRLSAALGVATAELAFALTAGLAIAHRDCVRIALEGWSPALAMLGLYVGMLFVRVVVLALAYACQPLLGEEDLRDRGAAQSVASG
jgi:hypothetical protein